MELREVMQQLEALGSAQSKKVLMSHGAREPFYGVKVGDLKLIQKKIKKNYELSLALYATGNSDAMYLAGMIAEPQKMSKEELNTWVEQAYWSYLSEFAVPWTASESHYGWELGLEWIESEKETTAAAGWATLGSVLSITKDVSIDHEAILQLLKRIRENIHQSPNRVRYTMNNFVIAAGSYCPQLTSEAKETGLNIGKVAVDFGGTACKVPYSPDYISKLEQAGTIGKKRKTAFC